MAHKKFEKNQTIATNDGDVQILDVLGEGGQGCVYLVSYQGSQYALKAYIDRPSKEFELNLKENVEKGSPCSSFLWPKKMLTFKDADGNEAIGYLMDLRKSNFVSFISYLTAKSPFKDTYTLVTWCINLCYAFKKLHEKGYSYQDLNDGSFFLDQNTGDVLVCDNDNVSANKKSLGILGKMKYMAPEIVRRDLAKNGEPQMPDVHSDRFSLAVVLFLALCLGNPFEGERLKNYDMIDENAEYELYGKDPVFVYSRNDDSNRPIRGYHVAVLRRWPLLPAYVKDAFHRTFTEGLSDRENGRTTEIEWIRLLSQFRDELVTCDSCGNHYVYGFEEAKQNGSCPFCNSPTKTFCTLTIDKSRIVLEPDKKIYETHIDKYSSEYNRAIGVVIRSRSNPGIWGIRLMTQGPVMIEDTHGTKKTIEPGGVIPIVKGLKISFSENVVGEIKIKE